MRRALREEWPALSHFFGLSPRDADPRYEFCLSWGELEAYRSELRRIAMNDPK